MSLKKQQKLLNLLNLDPWVHFKNIVCNEMWSMYKALLLHTGVELMPAGKSLEVTE